jgi:hypothetical protein
LTPDAPHVLLQIGIGEARGGRWLEAASTYERLQASYARYGMANQAWGPRGIFRLGVGRVREAIPALERARAEEPLAPAFAGFLGEAELASGDFAGALAEVDRGLALEGLDVSLLATGVTIALSQKNRAEIDKRLMAMSERAPDLRIAAHMAQFMDGRAGAGDEIRRLAVTAGDGEKATLPEWAAYFNEPALALELLTVAAPNLAHPPCCGSRCSGMCADCRRSKSWCVIWVSWTTGTSTAGRTSVIRCAMKISFANNHRAHGLIGQ